MLKTLKSIGKMDGFQAMRLLATTSADIGKVPELKDMDLLSNEDPDNLARLAITIRFTKIFQSAILLYINNSRANDQLGKTKDEIAYALMIEDFAKDALKSSKSHYLLPALPQLIASGFVSIKTKDSMMRSFEKLISAAEDPQKVAEPGFVTP